MLHTSLTDWPIRGAAWTAPQPRGGVAPSRYDVALMHHIEKQAAHRESMTREIDIWGAATGLFASIARGSVAAFRAVSARPRDRVA